MIQAEMSEILDKAVLYFGDLDRGFVIIEVNEYILQKDAIAYITSNLTQKKCLVADLKGISHEETTHLHFVRKNVMENPDVSVFLILNLHTLAKHIKTGEQGLIQDLNFSREPYANLKRILVFFLPVYFVDLIIHHAKDFYDFVPVTFKLLSKDVRKWEQPDEQWVMADEKFLHNRIGFLESFLESDSLTDKEKAGKLSDLADCYAQLYKNKEALDIYKKVMFIYQKFGDIKNQALILKKSGSIYRGQGDFEAGLNCFNRSLDLYKKSGDKKEEASVLNKIGDIYRFHNDIDIALEYFNQSLKLIKDQQGEGQVLNNISLIYRMCGEYHTALEYLDNSLKVMRKDSDRQGEIRTMGNIGSIYYIQGKYNAAIDYMEQSLKLSREIGDRREEAKTLHNFGHIYHRLGKYDMALDYIEQSTKLVKATNYRHLEEENLNNIAQIYYEQGRIRDATDYIRKSVLMARELNLPTLPEREKFFVKLGHELKENNDE